MKIISRSTRELLEQTDIERLWSALGGGRLKNGRGQAFWRGGDGFNIQLYTKSNTWRDHARGEGGGILALIEKSHGCSRQASIRWLHEYHGEPWRTATASLERRREVEQRRYDALLQKQLRDQELTALRDERNTCYANARAADVLADDGRDNWAALVASAVLERNRATAYEGRISELESKGAAA